MAEDDPKLPLEYPDAPEAIKWFRWLPYHLAHEGRMIRQAPVAFAAALLFLGAIVGYFEYQLLENHFLGQIADLSAANQRLDATAKSLQATIQFQDARLAASAGHTQVDREVGESRIIVTRYETKGVADPIAWNVYFKNTGNIAAVGFRTAMGSGIFPSQETAEQLDEIFKQIKSSMKDIEARRVDTEIQSGEESFLTYPFLNVPRQDYVDKVVNGTSLLHLFMIVEYHDVSTPPGKWRATEICSYTLKSDAVHHCDQHNRVFVSD
jgi:hypothetical protein